MYRTLFFHMDDEMLPKCTNEVRRSGRAHAVLEQVMDWLDFAYDAGSFDYCLPGRIYNRTFDCLEMAQAALQDMLHRPNVAELQGLVCCLISFHFGPDWAQELCAASIPHLDERDGALVARWTTVEQCCETHPPFTCIMDAVRNYEVRCELYA